MAKTVREKFFSHVDKTNDCWLWTGTTRKGYGRFWMEGRHHQAHRVALSLDGVDISDGYVLHSCHNPSCVRAEHLRVGTQQENMDDMKAAGRSRKTPTMVGTGHWARKLAEDDVRAIRKSTESQGVLSARYGVSRRTIRHVRNRRTWRHL